MEPHLRCAVDEGVGHERMFALYPMFASRDPARCHAAPCSLARRRWMALPQVTRGALEAVEELRGWLGMQA